MFFWKQLLTGQHLANSGGGQLKKTPCIWTAGNGKCRKHFLPFPELFSTFLDLPLVWSILVWVRLSHNWWCPGSWEIAATKYWPVGSQPNLDSGPGRRKGMDALLSISLSATPNPHRSETSQKLTVFALAYTSIRDKNKKNGDLILLRLGPNYYVYM